MSAAPLPDIERRDRENRAIHEGLRIADPFRPSARPSSRRAWVARHADAFRLIRQAFDYEEGSA